MKLNKHRRSHQLLVNMTPMIDIVFLLIIFFITVNQVTEANRTKMELPTLQGSQDQSKAALTINVDEAGEIIIAGQAVSLADLVRIVSAELAGVDNEPSRLTVVLRADRRGNSRTVNEVIRLLTRLDIGRVRFSVEKPA
ncbi:MAG TPA: biopolymer transporter ExbD [Pirellulaceae bacterium]|nr:biopolymer transporter ExbD [Pirellulaceae bacterium]